MTVLALSLSPKEKISEPQSGEDTHCPAARSAAKIPGRTTISPLQEFARGGGGRGAVQ